MKSLLLLLAIWIFIPCELIRSQPPIPGQRSIADSLRDEGDIPGAISEYRKLFLKNPEDRNNIYNFACALSVGKQVDSCYKYLNIAIRMDTSVAVLLEPDLLTARKDKRWESLEDTVVASVNKKFKTSYKDIDYAKKLWKLRAYDQAYFTQVGIAARKTGMKSSVVEALWDFKFMIQERNQEELVKLVSEKGWPKVADVGNEAAMAAFLVVMHSRNGLQKKYIEDIRKACMENELSWEWYARVFDRARYNENIPQKYGTHTRYNEKTGKEELYPLEDESKVDEWRKDLGLEPLSEYLAKFGIKYPL